RVFVEEVREQDSKFEGLDFTEELSLDRRRGGGRRIRRGRRKRRVPIAHAESIRCGANRLCGIRGVWQHGRRGWDRQDDRQCGETNISNCRNRVRGGGRWRG